MRVMEERYARELAAVKHRVDAYGAQSSSD